MQARAVDHAFSAKSGQSRRVNWILVGLQLETVTYKEEPIIYKIKNYRRIAFHLGLMLGASCSFLWAFIAFLAASEIIWVIAIGLIGFAAGMSSGEQLTSLLLLTPSKRKLINAEIASIAQ